jgi:hypothetical protein
LNASKGIRDRAQSLALPRATKQHVENLKRSSKHAHQ